MSPILAAWITTAVNGMFIGSIIFGLIAIFTGRGPRISACLCVVTGVVMLAFIYVRNLPIGFGIPPLIVLSIAFMIVWRMKKT